MNEEELRRPKYHSYTPLTTSEAMFEEAFNADILSLPPQSKSLKEELSTQLFEALHEEDLTSLVKNGICRLFVI
ncbi:hypothetical protein CR513_30025, partial [Mucuna pruriens]